MIDGTLCKFCGDIVTVPCKTMDEAEDCPRYEPEEDDDD